jgi:Skp family chaperone for outer membrane proteins
MKAFRFLALGLFFSAILAVNALAQAPAQPAANIKVMFINTAAFEATDGITRYTAAIAALNRETEPARAELRTMLARHDTLAKELQTLETQLRTATGAQRDTLSKQYDTKSDEYQNLGIQIKRKQEDGKKRYDRRQNEMFAPILEDIAKAMQDYAKQRGYAVIFDISKLTQAVLVYDSTKADVTKDFITFYNARPATR